MNKLPGKDNVTKGLINESIQKLSENFVGILKETVKKEIPHVIKYVDQIKKLNPDIDNKRLAKKVISRRSLKAGGIGTISGLGGMMTMPIALPSDLYYTFRVQARMVLALAYIYGWDIHDEDTITDILLVMSGNAGINALKNGGIKVGQEFAKKGVQKFITREMMKKINKVLSRKIITKAGEKSLTSFTKLVPFVGAPIGGTFNYFGTMGIGKTALAFYSG